MRSRLKSSSVCWYHLTRYSCTYFVCTFLVLFIYFVWFCLVYTNIPFLPFVKSFHFEVGIIRGEETVSHRLKILGHSPSTSNARQRERDVQRNIILQRAENPWVIKHAREMKWAFLRIFVLERIKAHEQTHIKSFSVSEIMNKTEYCVFGIAVLCLPTKQLEKYEHFTVRENDCFDRIRITFLQWACRLDFSHILEYLMLRLLSQPCTVQTMKLQALEGEPQEKWPF